MNRKLNNIAGSCLCGSVKFRVFGEVDTFYLCHCSRCQRSTGTAHVANIFTQPGNIGGWPERSCSVAMNCRELRVLPNSFARIVAPDSRM